MNTLAIPTSAFGRDRNDESGPERDETSSRQRLGSLLRRMTAEADARIPAERRAPRTAAERRARINRAAGRACRACEGAGGTVTETSAAGVTRRSWHSCQSCKGTGTSG
ncbi:hypothetical protein [Streptomyces sp. bgisy060]|uniref:hypothetical protein n=1 Tax=Streptomyces sp. bgisy060 TaxID=3413775 RepID=UPI003EBA72D7